MYAVEKKNTNIYLTCLRYSLELHFLNDRLFTNTTNDNVTLVTFLIPGSHVTTQKLQFAEEGPSLQVESYELSKTLCWCERLINSITTNKLHVLELTHKDEQSEIAERYWVIMINSTEAEPSLYLYLSGWIHSYRKSILNYIGKTPTSVLKLQL